MSPTLPARYRRPSFLRPRCILAGAGVLAAFALVQAPATIGGPDDDAAAAGASPLPAIQDVVSNTVQAMEGLGLTIDPVQARLEVRRALLTVADPGAVLLNQEDTRLLKARAGGLFYDTGIRLTLTNGSAEVASVRPASAAAEAGVEVGWVIESINQRPVEEQRLVDVRRMLRDRVPGTLELAFRDADGGARTLKIAKQEVRLPAIEHQEDLPLDLRYLHLNTLGAGAGEEVAGLLKAWAGAGAFGVVLDLRGTGGDDTDAVARIVELLARRGERLFRFEDAGGNEISSFTSDSDDALGMPLMVLVDEQTSGAAELLAATLSGTGRGAMLLGTPTVGDPLIRDQVELPGGDAVYIATRRLVTNGGKVYDGRDGVRPDVVVVLRDRSYRDYEPPPPLLTDRREKTEEEEQTLQLRQRTRGDVALTRAVDVLLGLKALDIHGFGFDAPASR